MTSISQKPIGILGGTFDPIHLGHLHVAFSVIHETSIEQIKFIPCYQPVHRSHPLAKANDRVEMIKLAIKDLPQFSLDERELQRKNPSFMIDTLISLRDEFPLTPLALIVGSDTYLNLPSWKRWQELLDYAHLIVANRSLFDFNDQPNAWLHARVTENKANLTKKLAGSILFLHAPLYPISATQIRQKIQNHEDISDLVPPNVVTYINSHSLYVLPFI